MYRKRSQVMFSNDVIMSENVHHDDAFVVMGRKRHCNLKSPFETTATGRQADEMEDQSKSENVLSQHEVELSDKNCGIRHATSQWSEEIIEGMKRVHSGKDLKALLCEKLNEFYLAVCHETSDKRQVDGDSTAVALEEMATKINQLVHRNNVLYNLVRHQYDTIKKLQASESMNANLIKEKEALSEQLRSLKQCVNTYIASVDGNIVSYCGPFESHSTRRPPDVF